MVTPIDRFAPVQLSINAPAKGVLRDESSVMKTVDGGIFKPGRAPDSCMVVTIPAALLIRMGAARVFKSRLIEG